MQAWDLSANYRGWGFRAPPRQAWHLSARYNSWHLAYTGKTLGSGTMSYHTAATGWGCQTACGPAACVTCCQGPIYKRSNEQRTLTYDWRPAFDDLTGYRLTGLVVTPLAEDGTPIPVLDLTPLAVALDGITPMIINGKDTLVSKVVLTAGTDDTDYRVNLVATIKDCDGFTQTLFACVLVSIKDC